MSARRPLHIISRAFTAIVLLTTLEAAATAQDWPARPVTMVVPTAAGGGADILGRILGARLAELLGQPLIIETDCRGARLFFAHSMEEYIEHGRL